jgi:hypothetical protein
MRQWPATQKDIVGAPNCPTVRCRLRSVVVSAETVFQKISSFLVVRTAGVFETRQIETQTETATFRLIAFDPKRLTNSGDLHETGYIQLGSA